MNRRDDTKASNEGGQSSGGLEDSHWVVVTVHTMFFLVDDFHRELLVKVWGNYWLAKLAQHFAVNDALVGGLEHVHELDRLALQCG